jgi:antitoxin component HigA of HigAB toxin-antitoxin module
MELVGEFPLRPIHSDSEHQRAKRMLRSSAGERGGDASDYKAVLVGLIAAYEKEKYAGDMPKLSAGDIVRHLLAERSMSVNALAKAAGVAQSSLSDMLNGKRDWSKSAIVRVADYLGLQRGLFLR